MALTTGTASAYASEFHFPSGTAVYACQVIGYPELKMGERNITNHGNGGWEERVPNGLNSAGDFTIQILVTPQNYASLNTDRAAKTERTAMIKDPVGNMTFVAWVATIKKEDGDATNPDSVKATVVITPRGEIA